MSNINIIILYKILFFCFILSSCSKEENNTFIAKIPFEKKLVRSDFLESAINMKNFLAEKNIKLCIVILPLVNSLLADRNEDYSGDILKTPNKTVTTLFSTVKQLKKLGLEKIFPYNEFYDSISRNPEKTHFHNHLHYNKLGDKIIIDNLKKDFSLNKPNSDEKNNYLFLGDCIARSLAINFNKIGMDGIKYYCVFSGSNLGLYNISLLPDNYFKNVKKVYWFLNENYLLQKKRKKYVFAPMAKPISTTKTDLNKQKERWVTVKFKKKTEVEFGFEKKSVYKNAVIIHKFETVNEQKETIIGLLYIMKNKIAQNDVRIFDKNLLLRIKIVPIEIAYQQNTSLKSEMVFDDINDYHSPRYWIKEWIYISM